MSLKKLSIKAALMIQKPLHDVYEAIIDPEIMSNYFIESSTGRMEEGKTVTWKFPEFDMSFPVTIGKLIKDKYVSFRWADPKGNETLVELNISSKGDNSTFVEVTEKERDNDEEGIAWLANNTMGWANFLACMKAWLEYGVHLRKGAFDISQMPVE
jgi:uncharacterized protein YndB with AHSA1/START domain